MSFALNLYPLLVESVFGGLLMAGIGIAIAIVIIGFFSRMSEFLIICLVFSFVIAYGIGYVGLVFAIPAFVISATYFWLAVYNFFMQKYS